MRLVGNTVQRCNMKVNLALLQCSQPQESTGRTHTYAGLPCAGLAPALQSLYDLPQGVCD